MTATVASSPLLTGFSPLQYAVCLKGIVWREGLRFLHQRERFVAALVRPLVWLFIFRRRLPAGARGLHHPSLRDIHII